MLILKGRELTTGLSGTLGGCRREAARNRREAARNLRETCAKPARNLRETCVKLAQNYAKQCEMTIAPGQAGVLYLRKRRL